ncbi:MAG TPA: Fe-S cluster assembly protein SufD [Microvirga sp.]|jgi:Fe-S cluster assembly protein SufD
MGAVTLMRTPAETALAQAFEAAKGKLPGDRDARVKAFNDFIEVGLPHRRVEAFKYTDLRAAFREAAPFAPRPTPEQARTAAAGAKGFGETGALVVTLVDGHVVTEGSELADLPEGVEITTITEAHGVGHTLLDHLSPVPLARENPVYQLNSAFMTDGVVIRIAATIAVERPIHLRFVTTGAFATATRTLVVVEEAASVILLESHEGPDGAAAQLNDVVEFVVGDRAKVCHVRLNAEGSEAVALSTVTARLGEAVSFDSLNVVWGAALSRHQVYLAFAGERSLARINGATMVKGRQHADSTLVVDHGALHCTSRELFKTVIDGEGTGVFQGKIIVQPHAQKTDGRMMSASLLLSEGGTMNNKPELEIFADDVQCAHGATSGQLDEDLLFYIMARGIPKAEAESLLVQAFLGEAIEGVECEAARDALIAGVESWLKAR